MRPAQRVHWNGRLVPIEEATVSVFDTGFLYGDGIYETLRIYDGQPFAFERHWHRLEHSAAGIGLELPPRESVRGALRELLEAEGWSAAVSRITITRGRLTHRLDLSTAGEPSVLVAAEALDPNLDETRRRGVRVIYSRFVRPSDHSLAGVKSTNYQVSLLARNEAREAGAAEALVPNESGDIVEAAAANVFLVENGELVTPPLRSGILGGITREVVIELAEAAGRRVHLETLPRPRIVNADEVFLTGTTIEVTPVTQLDEGPVGNGEPGPVTRELLAGYLDAVAKDKASPSGGASERIR